jgi:hypothetical protein
LLVRDRQRLADEWVMVCAIDPGLEALAWGEA